MSKVTNKLCVYCGKVAEDEDHIPSKNLYKGITTNLNPIKVPACKECNNTKLSKDEVYFRDLISGLMYKSSLSATSLFDTSVTKSIRRKPSLAKSMFKKMELVKYYKSGVYLGVKTKVETDNDRVFNVVEKYIKALFYHKFNKLLPKNWLIDSYWLTPKLEKIVKDNIKNMKWEMVDENIFLFGYNYVPETFQSMWCLVFYGKPLFFTLVMDKERAHK